MSLHPSSPTQPGDETEALWDFTSVDTVARNVPDGEAESIGTYRIYANRRTNRTCSWETPSAQELPWALQSLETMRRYDALTDEQIGHLQQFLGCDLTKKMMKSRGLGRVGAQGPLKCTMSESELTDMVDAAYAKVRAAAKK